MKLYPDLELNQTPLHQKPNTRFKKSEPNIDEFTLLRISETSPLYNFFFLRKKKKKTEKEPVWKRRRIMAI